jgi:peptidoglycan glycosyltransferase
MSTSAPYLNGRVIAPTSRYVDVGRMGIGQDKLEVTPLQMAEVAAAVANQGRLMTPHLTGRIVDSEGRTVTTVGPRVQSVVMKPSTADAVRGMMEAVVKEGTGTPAQIPGVQVAGKTGTAETQIGTAINNVWFIAFAPASNPRVAIAATLKGVPGQGAAFAAPVARAVIERLLRD